MLKQKNVTGVSAIVALLATVAVSKAACPGDTQTEMNQCAAADYKRADAELTSIYNQLKHTPQLKAAERAWIAYRDTECVYEHHATPEGSMYIMEEMLCKMEVTKQRINTLENALKEDYGNEE